MNPFEDDDDQDLDESAVKFDNEDLSISGLPKSVVKAPGFTGSQGSGLNVQFGPQMRDKLRSFTDPIEKKVKGLRLHQLAAVGDEAIVANFNYDICVVGTEDFFLSGHEQLVKFNKFTNNSRVIRHGIPLVFNYFLYRHWEFLFPRNEAVVVMNNGGKKKQLSRKFKGSYYDGKFDMRSRGVVRAGCLLYFQAIPADLVLYNMDFLLASIEDGSSYEGEVVAKDVEAFAVDQSCSVWTLGSRGRLAKLGSTLETVIRSNELQKTRFTCVAKVKTHLMVSSYSESLKTTVLYLYNDSNLGVLDLFSLDQQTSHVHQMMFLEAQSHPLLLAASLYTLNLFAIVQDRLVALDLNQAPIENILNSVVYDNFSNTIYVADTRRLVKAFTIR